MTGIIPKIQTALETAMIEAQRNVALARLRAFEDECFLLGELARRYDRKTEVADFLQSIAEANGIVRTDGDGLVHMMIAAGLRGDA